MAKKRENFKEWLLDIVYPRHIKCIFCGEELNENADKDTCEDCAEHLPYNLNPCPKCGNPMGKEEVGVCFECKTKNYEFDQAISSFDYSGKVVKAVHDFKFEGNKPLYEPLAEYMCETLAGYEIKPDIVTFVPMQKKKQKQRGYNQAELLARFIANKFGYPCAEIVEKVKDNQNQASLNFADRQANIVDAFAVKKEFIPLLKGLTVLLVDDVFTTGATSNEISKVLKQAGADKVFVLTLAHTKMEKDL